VIPSVDEAAIVEYLATAANTPPPYVTDCQFELEGKVLAVQVIPSVEDAAAVELLATAANTPPP
jgi:hypothetical protein